MDSVAWKVDCIVGVWKLCCYYLQVLRLELKEEYQKTTFTCELLITSTTSQ